MERINGAGATPDHLFTEGDPGQGIDATTVTATWLNGAQEELVGIIEKAGIAPDAANNAQVLAALRGWVNPDLYVDQDFGDYTTSAVVQFGDAGLITIEKAGWYHIRVNFLVTTGASGGTGNIRFRKEDNSALVPGWAGLGGTPETTAYMDHGAYFQATAGQKIKIYATLSGGAAIDTLYLQLMRIPFIPA